MKQNVKFEDVPSVLTTLVEKIDGLIAQVNNEKKSNALLEEYYTVEDVKRILQVKEGALHNYKVNGDLIPTGKGKFRRYKVEDLKRFIDAKRA